MSDRPCDHLPAFMIEKDQKTGSLAFRAECILCGMHGRACASMDEAEQDWDLLTAGEPRRCERSGVVRRAFIARGFDAWSCDTEPADDGSNRHIRDDVRNHLDGGWDLLAVMHPPCTILCNSGVKWLYIGGKKVNGPDPQRWAELGEAADFYRTLRDARQIQRRAIENPVMHRYAIEMTRRGRTQFVQPWWFGDPYFKATGLELIGLPDLHPTNRLTPPRPGTAEHKAWSRVHREPPGPDRARRRSETFPGLAAAMAKQWGEQLLTDMERLAA